MTDLSRLLRLPPFTNLWVVLLIFVLALFVFHVVLVKLFPLTKVGWKKVDYIWLGFTALGLIGSTSQARQLIASNSLSLLDAVETDDRHDPFIMLIKVYDNSAEVCRTFVRSDVAGAKRASAPTVVARKAKRKLSPPADEFDRIQREYDSVCSWISEISKRTAADQRFRGKISDDMLPEAPQVTAKPLIKIMDEFHGAIVEHNALRESRARLAEAKRRSTTETVLVILSPILIAVALALRITKVTGELRLT